MNRLAIPVLRRVGLAAGVAAVAALGGGVAAGASAAASTVQATAHVADCATSHLSVWYGEPGGAAAGSQYIPLEFTNIGTTDCALYGFPGVSAVSIAGAQLGSPASWNHAFAPKTVVLAPGGTSHVVLQIVDVANYGGSGGICSPATVYGLRVYPPNQKASEVIPFTFRACTKRGPNFLGVDAVNAGTGVPRYSDH